MRRGLMIAALPLVLGGCLPALPPAITLASTGLTGLTFLTTGKSTTDHVISAAVDEDCSMLRVVFGDQPCREYDGENTKPLTEIVAYYPGDDDGGVDAAHLPHGTLSGTTLISWGAESSESHQENTRKSSQKAGEMIAGSTSGSDEITASLNANLDTLSTPQVVGFAPIGGRRAPEPIRVEVIDSAVSQAALPPAVSQKWQDDLTASAEQQASIDVAAADVGAIEIPGADKAGEGGMALPMLRPAHEQGNAGAAEDHFVMVGSFRDMGRAERLQHQLERERAVMGAPVIMSVRLKGSLWHRVALGPFTGRQAVALASGMEPVSGKKAWAARVAN